MSDANSIVYRTIRRVTQMQSYLGRDECLDDLAFVPLKQGEICVKKTDQNASPNELYLFDILGEVEREGSYCSPQGTYDPDPRRRSPRFPTDITSAKIRLAIRKISHPRFRQLIQGDWHKFLEHIQAIHNHAFASDPDSMPKDRTNPVRYRRITVQHNLLVAREKKDSKTETTYTSNTSGSNPATEPGNSQSANPPVNNLPHNDNKDFVKDDVDDASVKSVDGSNNSDNESDGPPPLEEFKPQPQPHPYSNEGWPVPADGAWRAELDSVSDKYKIDPLVAWLIKNGNGDGEPIPPSEYSDLIPGSIVHLRVSFLNYVFTPPKTVMVAVIEELNVIYRAPPVPESPTKKRFMDKAVTTPSPSGSPTKKSRHSC